MMNRIKFSVRRQHSVMLLIALLIVFCPQISDAAGRRESEREYRLALEISFERLISAVATGETDPGEAKKSFAELRKQYRKTYDDESGILDALIDQVAEGDITVEEALFSFSLLQEKRLMEYRIARQNRENKDKESGNDERENGGQQGDNQQQGGNGQNDRSEEKKKEGDGQGADHNQH